MPVRLSLGLAFLLAAVSSVRALDPRLPPGGNFDLSHWKLTLPTGPALRADEILPSRLEGRHGYASKYFFTGPDGAMVFWCPVNGTTTGGTEHPRSELREMRNDRSSRDWYERDGVAVLTATCRVLRVPSKTGRTVIGQIHGKSLDLPLLKLAYDRDRVVALVKLTARSDHDTPYPLARVPLGQPINYEIRLIDGLLAVTANGVSCRAALAADWEPISLYFKAGDYVQAHGSSSTDGGMVAFYALRASHTPAAPAPR